jgi:hypothetical protein
MATVLFVVGGIGFIVWLVLLVVSAARKRPVRNALIGLGVCLAVFVVGYIMTPVVPDEPGAGAAQVQQDANMRLKQEAVKADFIKINGGEVADGAKLLLEGKVGVVMDEDGKQFSLSTDEGDGHGVYNIVDIGDSPGVTEGDIVTIWGTYQGKDKNTGIPIIAAHIVEK